MKRVYVRMFVTAVVFGFAVLAISCAKNDKTTNSTKTTTPTSIANTSDGTHWALVHKKDSPDDIAVAVVGGEKIYASEIRRRLNKLSPVLKTRYQQFDMLKEYLNNNIIRNEVLVRAAIEEGLDKDPEVIKAARQMMVQKLIQRKFKNIIKPSDISDKEIQEYFEAHKKDYNRPEQRRASHILIRPKNQSAAAWKEAKKRAEKILKEVKKNPAKFADIAREKSEDRGNAALGGDLGYFARTEDGGRMQKEFSDAVFRMKQINDITGPVKTKYGYHIIKLTGIRKPRSTTLDEVKNSIRNILYKQKRAEMFEKYMKELRKKYNVEILDDALRSIAKKGSSIFEPQSENGIIPSKLPSMEKPDRKDITNRVQHPPRPVMKPTYGKGKPAHEAKSSSPAAPKPTPKPTQKSNKDNSKGTK